jgi:Tol biopolymer transport system component
MRYVSVIVLLFVLVSSIHAQDEERLHFALLTNAGNLYLYDGLTADKITSDWVVTFTATDNAILAVTDTVNGQNIVSYDMHGHYQSTLTDFDAENTPIWVDLAYIPFSNELIGEFETIGTAESGLYRFDPANLLPTLSYVGRANYSNPDVSYDGRYLVFDRNAERLTDLNTPFPYSAIVLYDLETTAWVYVTSELQGNCGGAQWNPTQNRIVYSCLNYENISRVYVTHIESAETEQLPLPDDARLIGCDVMWSPDGNSIAYNTTLGLYILSLETMTFELVMPSDYINEGVSCFEWLS